MKTERERDLGARQRAFGCSGAPLSLAAAAAAAARPLKEALLRSKAGKKKDRRVPPVANIPIQ